MMLPYNRDRAVDYARKWTHRHNPDFPYVCGESGNSTNFASQCLLAGSGEVDHYRWHCRDGCTEAWASPQALCEFLLGLQESGPVAAEVYPWALQPGDVVQVHSREGFWRTLVVTGNNAGEIRVAAHSYSAQDRPLDSYRGQEMRCLHILGVRANEPQ